MLSSISSLFPSRRGNQVLQAIVFLLATHCSDDGSTNAPEKPSDSDPQQPSNQDLATIEFTPSDTLKLTPGATATIEVRVQPAEDQEVTFEILSETAEFDGYLLASKAKVQKNGRAQVELEAPSQPGSFVVRASLSEREVATRAISVHLLGYGILNVSSNYAGKRQIQEWSTAIRPDTTCDELDSYFEEGGRVLAGHQDLVVEDVPSGVPIAVIVRGDRLVSGCTTVSNLIAESEQLVLVELKDRPLDLKTTALKLTMEVDSTTTEFANHFEAAIRTGIDIFRGEDETDAAALIRVMGEQLTDSYRAELYRKSESFTFSELIQNIWGDNEVISDVLASSMAEATESMTGIDTFVGTLAIGEQESTFNLKTAAGVEATGAGFPNAASWTVTVQSGDTLIMGGDISYQPLRWLTAIVEAHPSSSIQTALIEAAHCPDLAQALTEAADGPAFSDCETDCLAELCETALDHAWQSIAAQETEESSTLKVAISGTAEVVSPANVKSFKGTWVGRLNEDESSVKGAILGEVVAP